MITGADILDGVLQRLDESTTAPVFWSRAELLTHLNDGFRELNLMTAKVQSEMVLSPIASTFQLTPSGAIAVLHLSNNLAMVRKRDLERMDREHRTWQKKTGNLVKAWGSVGLNLFFIFPKLPAGSAGLTIVTLDHPAAITEATIINLDEEYVEALENYVFHMARFKEGGAEWQQSMAAYENFRQRAGFLLRRRTEHPALFAKEPAADTGLGYSTSLRN